MFLKYIFKNYLSVMIIFICFKIPDIKIANIFYTRKVLKKNCFFMVQFFLVIDKNKEFHKFILIHFFLPIASSLLLRSSAYCFLSPVRFLDRACLFLSRVRVAHFIVRIFLFLLKICLALASNFTLV